MGTCSPATSEQHMTPDDEGLEKQKIPDPAGARPLPPRLVDPAWLQGHLDDSCLRVVEVGQDSGAYHEGHVPGAVAVAWLDDLHDPDRRGVLSQNRLEQLLGCRGISPDTHVVLYGDEDNAFAAYAYWVLRYYQHRAVSLLDGGRRAWVDQHRPLVRDSPPPAVTSYSSIGPDDGVRVSRDVLLARYVDGPPGTAVVDCREATEYQGRHATTVDLPLRRHRLGGHVPGARNVASLDLLDGGTGLFKSREQLRRSFAQHGISPEADIAMYCDVGGQSSIGWFVLHDLLDYPQVRNYDGGWAEYGSLVGAPVER